MIRYATREQIQALLSVAKKRSVRDYAILTVAYWRGLRASEVGMLGIEDYNPKTGRLFVHRVKGSVSAEYLLSPDERKALDAWIRVRGHQDPGPLFVTKKQSGMSRKMLHLLMQRYGEKAGWPKELRHPHVLRHSIAVHLVEQGVDLLAIKDWLGHRAISSTIVYAQLTNPARDRVAETVYRSVDPKVRVDWRRDKRK